MRASTACSPPTCSSLRIGLVLLSGVSVGVPQSSVDFVLGLPDETAQPVVRNAEADGGGGDGAVLAEGDERRSLLRLKVEQLLDLAEPARLVLAGLRVAALDELARTRARRCRSPTESAGRPGPRPGLSRSPSSRSMLHSASGPVGFGATGSGPVSSSSDRTCVRCRPSLRSMSAARHCARRLSQPRTSRRPWSMVSHSSRLSCRSCSRSSASTLYARAVRATMRSTHCRS